MGCGGNLAVERGDDELGSIPFRLELTPDMGGAGVEAEHAAFHALAEGLQPRVELRPSFSGRQAFDAPAEFPNGDGADVEQRLVLPQPRYHLRIRPGFGQFAEDVGIDEVTQRESGLESSVSRGGTSKGEGQASSKSTNP